MMASTNDILKKCRLVVICDDKPNTHIFWMRDCQVQINPGETLSKWGNTAYYNMTVYILAGNYISFTIAAGLIRLHMPGVKKSRV